MLCLRGQANQSKYTKRKLLLPELNNCLDHFNEQ